MDTYYLVVVIYIITLFSLINSLLNYLSYYIYYFYHIMIETFIFKTIGKKYNMHLYK